MPSPHSEQSGSRGFFQRIQDRIFPSIDDKRMPLLAHLTELRTRLLRAAVIMCIVFLGAFYFAPTLMTWVQAPLYSYFSPSKMAWVPSGLSDITFIFLSPAEAFWNSIKVSAVVATFIVMPYALYELWKFAEPGLRVHERRFTLPFVTLCSTMFYLGISFCYLVVLPFALNFLVGYGIDAGFTPHLSIGIFVGFNLWLLLVFGLIFELPMLMTLLAKLGLVDAPWLRKYRKWAYLCFFIMGAVLTPTPDPFNQTLMAVPLVVFYEVGIVGARFFAKPDELETPHVVQRTSH
ncbi:MAG TPA: twin-arginine translocase subunit TatC [Nitrospirales bacterium]|nr:twin-arginine translocase subunit TatC [Nitrospirales bacterium]